MTATIELSDVEKSYGATRALAGVSFATGKGVTGVLGPNGAGKTTLLRMVATVLAPDRGRIRLLDLESTTASGRLAIRRRLGYFPQEPGYYENFKAFDFVDYVAILKEMTNRNERHDEVRRVLAAVGLTDQMHKRLRKLSGGMRRRVILAQALLGEPDLLVLDEPTAGLDPEQRLRFRELISSIAEQHTVLLSTHQTEDVAAVCHRVVVIDRGSVRFDGTPADLKEQARGRVWHSDATDARALLSWRTGVGDMRMVGDPPLGAALVEPTIEDGYLLLLGRSDAESENVA
jgi:ABC-2 type transport system ATP-binding protein